MKNNSLFQKNLLELIRRTSTDLPSDVELALRRAAARERKHPVARETFDTILRNVRLARRNDAPLCQDTGTLTFYCRVPASFDVNALKAAMRNAIADATQRGYLRQNCVDSLTGTTYPTNIAHGSPVFRWEQGANKTLDVRLVMKGGGCENVGKQYSLPDAHVQAGRDLGGVRRCVLDAIHEAQGKGCAPGVLGVCIGGDREGAYACAKEQFLRKVTEASRVSELAKLERRIMKDARELGIGAMGLGGSATLLGVKLAALSRVPASFFVTVSYMCWAFRRRGVQLSLNGGLRRWLY